MSLCLAFASLIPHHVVFTPIVLLGISVFIIFMDCKKERFMSVGATRPKANLQEHHATFEMQTDFCFPNAQCMAYLLHLGSFGGKCR